MISRFTGENFLDKNKPKNVFDSLFFYCVAMALLVYAIAIPFFRVDYTSLPLTVGILAGLMWVPLSWIIQHWSGSSRRSADGSGDGRMVPRAASSVRGHSGGHRGRLRGHDCHPGAALARRQPQHRCSRYGVNPARH